MDFANDGDLAVILFSSREKLRNT